MVTRLKLSNNNNSVSCTATKGRDFFFLLDSRSLKRSPSSLTWSVFDPLFAYSYSLCSHLPHTLYAQLQVSVHLLLSPILSFSHTWSVLLNRSSSRASLYSRPVSEQTCSALLSSLHCTPCPRWPPHQVSRVRPGSSDASAPALPSDFTDPRVPVPVTLTR